MAAVTISDFEAYKVYSSLEESIKKKCTVKEILANILSEFGVVLLEKPTSSESAQIWLKEKNKLSSSLTRLIAQKNRKRKVPGDSLFFDSKLCAAFTKVVCPPKVDIDPDFSIESLNLDSDSEYNLNPQRKKLKASRGRKKGPILCDQTFRNRSKPIRD